MGGEVAVTDSEFNATDVRIERWFRSLTRAGQVIVKDGRLALLTSYGREIDSAPLSAVTARRRWFLGADSAVAYVNGVRYRLTMGQRNRRPGGAVPVGRFLAALRGGEAEATVPYSRRELRTPTP